MAGIEISFMAVVAVRLLAWVAEAGAGKRPFRNVNGMAAGEPGRPA
jgi:hypothetical protein